MNDGQKREIELLLGDAPPDVQEWLLGEVDVSHDLGLTKQKMPFWAHVFWLVRCNGGFKVGSWGCVSGSGNSQRGLDQGDAVDLIYIGGVMDGLRLGSDYDPYVRLMPAYERFCGLGDAAADLKSADPPSNTSVS